MKRNIKAFIVLSSLMAIGMAASGCGSNQLSGGWNITQNFSVATSNSSSTTGTTYNGGTSSYAQVPQCQTSSVSLTVSVSNNSIVGIGSGTCFSEQLTGTSSSNQITGATLQVNPASTQYGELTPCTFTGTLSVSNNMVSGTLTNVAATTTGTTTSVYSSCPASVTLNGST